VLLARENAQLGNFTQRNEQSTDESCELEWGFVVLLQLIQILVGFNRCSKCPRLCFAQSRLCLFWATSTWIQGVRVENIIDRQHAGYSALLGTEHGMDGASLCVWFGRLNYAKP